MRWMSRPRSTWGWVSSSDPFADHGVDAHVLESVQPARALDVPGRDRQSAPTGPADQRMVDGILASVQSGGTGPDPEGGVSQPGGEIGGPGQPPGHLGSDRSRVPQQAGLERGDQAATLQGFQECQRIGGQGQVKGVSYLQVQVHPKTGLLEQGDGLSEGGRPWQLVCRDGIHRDLGSAHGHGAVMTEHQGAVPGPGDVQFHAVIALVRGLLDRLQGVFAQFGHPASMAIAVHLAVCLLGMAVSGEAYAVEIMVRATVGADLSTVEGTLTVRGGEMTLTSPLERLEMPVDDLTTFRTFPGALDGGALRWQAKGEGVWTFQSELPRRYGALGALPGRGLWANGGWYPQPTLEDGGLPLASWDVQVILPEGAVGALNNTAGAGVLSWKGEADRLALAALAGGRITELGGPEARVVLVQDGRERPQRDAYLAAVFAALDPPEGANRVVVVEAPMFRRLVRPGPGLCFLSDRAFRLTRPLPRYHRVPVARGLLAAALPMADPWLRGIVAEPRVRAYAALEGAESPVAWLRFGRFIPWVDLVLSDGRTLFVGELFDEVHPSDPLEDDLMELYRAPTPAPVVAAWLEDLGGPGTSDSVGERVRLGEPLSTAIAAQGLDPGLATAWAGPLPDQDLVMSVDRVDEAWLLTVRRDAEADAASHPVVVEVDGQRRVWQTGTGPGEQSWSLEQRPRRVALDPDRHVSQRETAFDTWPARWTGTVGAAAYHLNLTQQSFAGLAWVHLRRLYDTRNLFQGAAYTDDRNLVGARLTARRSFGPLKDRRFRTHNAWLSVGSALLSEAFRPTDSGGIAVGGAAGWAWDTRVDWYFPTSGHRLWATLDGGLVPGGNLSWAAFRGGATWIWSPHPRHALAFRGRGGLAVGAVEHRLFSLGGDNTLRGVPAGQVVGSNQAVGMVEWRWAPIRNASLWLPTIWLTELQVSGGVEGGWVGGLVDAGVAEAAHEGALAVGWTLGLGVGGDWFGARPGLLTLTMARPVWTQGIEESPQLQVFLRGTQAF